LILAVVVIELTLSGRMSGFCASKFKLIVLSTRVSEVMMTLISVIKCVMSSMKSLASRVASAAGAVYTKGTRPATRNVEKTEKKCIRTSRVLG